MIWTLRENSILQAFHLTSMLCLALWMREIGYKEHSQGPFQSKGRGGRSQEGSCTTSRVCGTPVTSPESRGQGLRGARDPFSLSLQSWSLSRRLFWSLSTLGGGAQWPWRPVAHRKNTRVLYVAARPQQPGPPYHPLALEALATRPSLPSSNTQLLPTPRATAGSLPFVWNTFFILARRASPHCSAQLEWHPFRAVTRHLPSKQGPRRSLSWQHLP